MAKPLIKWAGGKTQLLPEITAKLPDFIQQGQPYIYVEPFLGSGAVALDLLDGEKAPNIAILNDINSDLINLYEVVRDKPSELLAELNRIQEAYDKLASKEDKKPYFYAKREAFNARQADKVTQASLFIFLNRAGFNGLYRVNRKNEFNVPIGSYTRPVFVYEDLVQQISILFQRAHLMAGDYRGTIDKLESLNSGNLPVFFYLDPPYKPISETASFTAYAQGEFGDEAQIELANFCQLLDEKGYHWLLSNSDPKSVDENATFFDDLYTDFAIERVQVSRSISAKGSRRGRVKELLINNV